MLRSFGIACGVGLSLYVAYKLVQRSRRSNAAAGRRTDGKGRSETSTEKHQPGKCDGCGTTPSGESLMRCGGCKRAWFCNTRCQKLYWPSHRQVCKAVVGVTSVVLQHKSGKNYRETLAFLERTLRRISAAPDGTNNMPMANQRTAMWAKGTLTRLQGDTYLRLNECAKSQTAYKKALIIAQAAGDYVLTADVMNGMSLAARRAGEDPDVIKAILATAMAAAEKAFLHNEPEALKCKASILSNLGVIHMKSSDSQQQGISQLEEALEIRKHLGDPYQVSRGTDRSLF